LDGPISLKKMTRQCVRELERQSHPEGAATSSLNRKQAARTLGHQLCSWRIRSAMPALPRTAHFGCGRRENKLSDDAVQQQRGRETERDHRIIGHRLP